jgi:EpsI family protein
MTELRGVTNRLIVATACLSVVAVVVLRSSTREPTLLRESLATFPTDVADWKTVRHAELSDDVLQVLGVNDYINRVYSRGTAGALGLYVGFYESQRQGDTVHSPLNCLPGAGWTPVSFDRVRIDVPSNAGGSASTVPIEVNRYVIEKGLDRQVVLYWYQGHGRVIASEYWGKFYLVLDAIRTNRTDAALVRITVPFDQADPSSERVAEQKGIVFVRAVFPLLERYLPA